MWMTDQVARYNPTENKWTLFDLPTRGGEVRYVSVMETEKGAQSTSLSVASSTFWANNSGAQISWVTS